MPGKIIELIKWLLIYGFLFYAAASLYVYFYANHIIFQPPHPPSYEDNPQIIKLKTRHGETISAIHLANPKAKYTILYSHGNALDLGELISYLKVLQQHNFSVFAYDYQGYGTSSGKPSEKNAYQDSEAAYDYLTKTLAIPPSQIIAYGKSIGAAVTIHLAAQKPLAGVILESPFVTAYRTVTHIPLFPFDKFNNLSKISKVKSPILVIHGEKDQIIPPWHSKKLYETAPSPKQIVWLPDLDHNDIPFNSPAYWQAIQSFIKTIQ